MNRRHFLALPALAATPAYATPPAPKWKFSLNTSTIQWKLPLPDLIDRAASVGYRGVEPWVKELDQYVKAGGSLRDLRNRAADKGVTVVDVIGFAEWIVDDDARRARGLDEAKRVMAMARELDCRCMAAPPVGATDRADLSLWKAADRYAELVRVGEKFEVVPLVEHWGHSKCLARLGEAVFIAMESHAAAAVLPDVFHLYKGGSDFAGLKLLNAGAVPVLHMNDYPAVERGKITDAQRVYPGDGVAPLHAICSSLNAVGFNGWASLELFNRDYWKQDPVEVMTTGLAKMRAVTGS